MIKLNRSCSFFLRNVKGFSAICPLRDQFIHFHTCANGSFKQCAHFYIPAINLCFLSYAFFYWSNLLWMPLESVLKYCTMEINCHFSCFFSHLLPTTTFTDRRFFHVEVAGSSVTTWNVIIMVRTSYSFHQVNLLSTETDLFKIYRSKRCF